MLSQLLRQFCGPGGGDIDVLRQPRYVHVSIHRLGTVQDGILPAAQELQNRVVNYGQRVRLAHDELPKSQRAVTEHAPSLLSQDFLLRKPSHLPPTLATSWAFIPNAIISASSADTPPARMFLIVSSIRR